MLLMQSLNHLIDDILASKEMYMTDIIFQKNGLQLLTDLEK